MDEDINLEEERMSRLNMARKEKPSLNGNSGNKQNVAAVLSLGQKISQHWLLLAAAALFDLLSLIPFIGIVFNFMFGIILWLYFGPKRKSGSNEILKIVLPIGLGSAIDTFLSILPVNISAAVLRIILS